MRRRTVFLSSTSKGFEDLRQALKFDLEQRGFEVLASEESNFPLSGNADALNECLGIVRGANYYMLLIGDAQGNVQNDTSPTREEYRAARLSRRTTGHPQTILTVRTSTREAVRQWEAYGERGKLGDGAEFISSFVHEVEDDGDNPNFLQRWGSYRDLMGILTTRLQLGRDHEATISRQAILDELLNNLASMVTRHRTSALPCFWGGGRMRRDIQIDASELGSDVLVQVEAAKSLAQEAIATNLDELQSVAIERAVSGRLFMDYDPVAEAFVPSPMHSALVQVLDDIREAGMVAQPTHEWRGRAADAAYRANTTQMPVIVPALDVIQAQLHYDRSKDVFGSQLALAKFLLGGCESPLSDSTQRSPKSPIRDQVDGLWREHVDAAEVQKLIEKDVSPFGLRFAGPLSEQARQARISQLESSLRQESTARGAELEGNWRDILDDPRSLRQVAGDLLDRMTAPEDGIENRSES